MTLLAGLHAHFQVQEYSPGGDNYSVTVAMLRSATVTSKLLQVGNNIFGN